MNTHLSAGKTGLVLGALLGGMHLCWTIAVALGWAQVVLDFIFWLHFIKPPFVVEAFDIMRAAMLVAMTAGMGFIFGSVFALAWNALHKD